MKIIRTLALSLILAVLASTLSMAAITQTDKSGPNYVRTTITATDTTNSMGDNCLAVQGYVYKSVIADEVSGTAVWNIGFTNDFGSDFSTLVTGEASDNSYEMTTAATSICVEVTTCSTCVLKVTIYAETPRKSQ